MNCHTVIIGLGPTCVPCVPIRSRLKMTYSHKVMQSDRPTRGVVARRLLKLDECVHNVT